MTKVNFSKTNECINIRISGHAFFANHGEDIVCAGISSIAYTIANQLLVIDEENVKVIIKEGLFEIEVNKLSNDKELLCDTLLNGMKLIYEQYPKNIEIREV